MNPHQEAERDASNIKLEKPRCAAKAPPLLAYSKELNQRVIDVLIDESWEIKPLKTTLSKQ